MSKRQSVQKPYWEMTTAELAKATSEFDRPFVADTFRPLTKKERALWERIKRGRGRPRRGRGAKVISLSLEQGLLEATDRVARKKSMSRSAFVAESLRTALRMNMMPQKRRRAG